MQRETSLCGACGLHLDLHARHVDAGRAFAAAGLARDAERHRLGHLVRSQRVRAELSRDREPQRIGAAARDVALVAGDAVARAHDAAVEFAAGAVVVAHLDGALETAAGAGPGRPVETRPYVLAAIARLEAEQRAVVEFRRPHHLARIEQAVRIEPILYFLEGAREARAEHRLVELRAQQSVAVLARMRALVFAHHGEGFFGDGAHGAHVLLEAQIEDRADMKAAGPRMRVPGAARAVPLEHIGETARIIGEMLERHRAVLDEGDGFALLLHRHHDVEAGRAQVGDRRLQAGIEHLDDAAPFRAGPVPAEAEIAHQFVKHPQAAQVFLVIVLAELDQQDCFRFCSHEALQRRLEDRDRAGQFDHGAVDQLDCDRLQPNQMLRGVHRLVEAAEMAGANGAATEQRRQLQFDAGREGERALAADQHVREVDVVLSGRQRVEIVAADAPLHLREARRDLVLLACTDGQQIARQRPDRFRRVGGGADTAEMRLGAIGEDGVDRHDVVAHRAVAQRAAATGVVAGHAADGGARGGRDVDRVPEAVLFKLAVEVVEDDARLDRDTAAGDVEIENAVEIFRAVDHQRRADRLAALRGAAATRQDGHLLRPGNGYRPIGFLDGPGGDHAHRRDLVVGCVGGVAAASERVEPDIASQLGLQPPFQAGHDYRHGLNP